VVLWRTVLVRWLLHLIPGRSVGWRPGSRWL